MIIFGWGHVKKKTYGPVIRHTCNHCHNIDNWYLIKISTWFTLFFVPIFPYKINYLLVCPICSWGIELEKNDFKQLIKIVEINMLLLNDKITYDEYKKLVANNTKQRAIETSSESDKSTNQITKKEPNISSNKKTNRKKSKTKFPKN